MSDSLAKLLREMWEWRERQPEYMNIRSAGEYGRQLLLRALLEERREMDDQ
jgi:hypothetical protein